MRLTLLTLLLTAPAALADGETFHGWSKDGSWLVFEAQGANELVELYFCATDSSVSPTWPAVLSRMDQVDERNLSCVHYLDPNKAPYQWKKLLQPLEAKMQFGALKVLPELVTDGDSPGFTLQAGDKKQTCYASGLRDDSKLQKVWFHSSGRWAAALIDGKVNHCAVSLKATSAPPAPKGGRPR